MGVATAIAIGGLAVTAATAANSFVQAGEAKSKQRRAEADAAAAMAEAKKKLEINFTDELAVQKEPYELQREAMLSQGAQAIQAGQESERGTAVTAGKVMMAQNEAQSGIRTDMTKEMTDIQNKKVAEASRLRDLGAQLDLGEAEGQQMIAANAEAASAAATQQGIQGLGSMASQGLGMVPLYGKTGAAPAAPAVGEAPTNPQPGNAQSYGPMGQNWAPMQAAKPSPPIFGPQTPAGTPFGPIGTNWSGVGY